MVPFSNLWQARNSLGLRHSSGSFRILGYWSLLICTAKLFDLESRDLAKRIHLA